jgi:hypothetical protein
MVSTRCLLGQSPATPLKLITNRPRFECAGRGRQKGRGIGSAYPRVLTRGDRPTKLEGGISRRSYLGLRTSFCRLRGGDVYLSRLDVIERTLATTAHGGVSLCTRANRRVPKIRCMLGRLLRFKRG